MGSDPNMDASIVVPTFNQSGMLKRLLASFDTLTYTGNFEIIIVDDCSPDDTPSVAEAWTKQTHPYVARYLRLEKNGGPGRARNAGARAGTGRIVAYTDTDCIVTPSWLENLILGINPEKKIVGAGGKVIPYSEASIAARYYAFHRTLEPPWNLQYLVSCNCCYLREEMLRLGAFDEDIPIPGGEDIAVSIKLWKAGWRFAFAENAVIYHDFNPTLKNFWKTWNNYGYGTGLVCLRMLNDSEMYPEWNEPEGENFWDSRVVRPSATGIRSYYYFAMHTLGECRSAEIGLRRTFEVLAMWSLNRIAYLRGWKKGERQHRQELKKNVK